MCRSRRNLSTRGWIFSPTMRSSRPCPKCSRTRYLHECALSATPHYPSTQNGSAASSATAARHGRAKVAPPRCLRPACACPLQFPLLAPSLPFLVAPSHAEVAAAGGAPAVGDARPVWETRKVPVWVAATQSSNTHKICSEYQHSHPFITQLLPFFTEDGRAGGSDVATIGTSHAMLAAAPSACWSLCNICLSWGHLARGGGSGG